MYEDYTIKPYISPDRDPNEVVKPVPKRNMEPLADGLLAGDIILLWRINFGTFTNETWYPKYFEYTYGIDGPSHLTQLLENGYAYEESAFDSLDHLNSSQKKAILKELGVKGLSKMKAADLDEALANSLSEEELYGTRDCLDSKGRGNSSQSSRDYRSSSKEKNIAKNRLEMSNRFLFYFPPRGEIPRAIRP